VKRGLVQLIGFSSAYVVRWPAPTRVAFYTYLQTIRTCQSDAGNTNVARDIGYQRWFGIIGGRVGKIDIVSANYQTRPAVRRKIDGSPPHRDAILDAMLTTKRCLCELPRLS